MGDVTIFETKGISQKWKKVRVEDIAESIQYGYTESSSKEKIGPKFLRITDIQNNSVEWTSVPYCKIDEDSKKKYLLKDGDLVFARTGATVGKSFLIKGQIPEAVFASYLIRLRFNRDVLDKYIWHYFQSLDYWSQITDGQVGIGQPNVNGTKLGQLLIPLPSIEEQHSIVFKIEELLSKLDTSIEDLKTAQQQLKVYRQSVLKWALEGRLTNEGLKEGELPEGWRWVKFGDVHQIKSNLVSPEKFKNFPHIAPDNISKGTARLLNFRTIKEDKVFSPKHRFSKGQILYSKIRPNLAKVIIAPFDGLCSADMYPIESSLDNKFTLYYMLSKFFVDKASNIESRTVLPKINQKGLNEIPFPLCPFNEQRTIVQEIESRLSVADKVEETIVNSLGQAEALRQSILKKAFEGKIV
jgi:type I restriction enzyme S subunit